MTMVSLLVSSTSIDTLDHESRSDRTIVSADSVVMLVVFVFVIVIVIVVVQHAMDEYCGP